MAPRRSDYGIAAALLALGALAVPLAVWWCRPVSAWEALREGPPPRAWASLLRQEARWREDGSHRRIEHSYVPLESISLELQLAVLVGEDVGFLGHGAVDLRAVWEAIGEWWRGRRLRGASTISQQLARTLFLSNERSVLRKLEEARVAWWLERRLGKRRILELYLNVVEFGPGVMGAEAAARHYFGTGAALLPAAEAASLAAAIPAPGRDNPTTASRRWQQRRAAILERMGHVDWLRRRLAAL